ncbi:hypothetical protein [Mycobacterium sp. 1423905.2]|uniref:hypothetical protein n=1 Tax=Mycobacterium sp. 1423905.2 TaxID=1856859 RepID=UPI0007FD334C|nr:hypothetical protein [Mycobacterium sp. 1423905.2]OBJ61629.1 hypothetical protein A9W95_09190 [Mycobacterium sp. 1423905.2]
MANSGAHPEQFLVEWYGPQAPVQTIVDIAGLLADHATAISARGAEVRLLMAMAIPADEYAFGVFAAESANTVAQVCNDANAPAERISKAIGWVHT